MLNKRKNVSLRDFILTFACFLAGIGLNVLIIS